jgi:hypothetical protein
MAVTMPVPMMLSVPIMVPVIRAMVMVNWIRIRGSNVNGIRVLTVIRIGIFARNPHVSSSDRSNATGEQRNEGD